MTKLIEFTSLKHSAAILLRTRCKEGKMILGDQKEDLVITKRT